jgi:hypothetical protein
MDGIIVVRAAIAAAAAAAEITAPEPFVCVVTET